MSYADTWQKWFHVIEQGAAGINARMLELAGLKAGNTALDIGTGIGEPALSAAAALSGGRVTAVDCDPRMIALARQRARARHVSNVDYHVMRAEGLQFPAQSFDAVLARWALMFVADVPAVYRTIRQLLRPGGRFVSTVWGPPDKVPVLSLATRVAHEHLGLRPPRFGPNTAFALSDVAAATDQIRAAGFTAVSGDWIKAVYEFPAPVSFVEFRIDCAATLSALMNDLSAQERRNTRAAIIRALEPYRLANGSVRMENWAYCIAAQV